MRAVLVLQPQTAVRHDRLRTSRYNKLTACSCCRWLQDTSSRCSCPRSRWSAWIWRFLTRRIRGEVPGGQRNGFKAAGASTSSLRPVASYKTRRAEVVAYVPAADHLYSLIGMCSFPQQVVDLRHNLRTHTTLLCVFQRNSCFAGAGVFVRETCQSQGHLTRVALRCPPEPYNIPYVYV